MSIVLSGPVDDGARSVFEDFTVAQVGPLHLLRDGDEEPLVSSPDSLLDVNLLKPGDRVRVELVGGRMIVHGRADGLVSTPYVTTGIGTIQSGWSLNYQRGLIRGGVAFVSIEFVRTGGTITVPATGDITNTAVFQLDAAWFPPSSPAGLLPGLTSSSVARVAAGTVNGTGMIQLVAVAPGANIVDGNTFSLYGSWPVA